MAISRRLQAAKRGFCLRRADLGLATLLGRQYAPEPGHLFLASVAQLGRHEWIELPDGRRARLYLDDEVVVCYGQHDIPGRYGARVGGSMPSCALMSSSGVAGAWEGQNDVDDRPTMLQPVGMLGDLDGRPLNLARFGLPMVERYVASLPVFAVLEPSRCGREAPAAANLIRGLSNAGVRVAAANMAGIGSAGDYWHMVDAGAVAVRDFGNCGLASTRHVSADTLRRAVYALLADLERSSPEHGVSERALPDAIVIQVSDGLSQQAMVNMIAAPWFRQNVDRALVVARDVASLAEYASMARKGGIRIAAACGLIVPDPLVVSEAVDRLGLRVLSRQQLLDPGVIGPLMLSR
ncbi:MAG: hypothetical protein E6Q88_12705 [Lysobacteraceae bacterium]|nr:MAG: hypothetical protein E6Q88_12705 [Xanthomonadaceae bacterium]